MHWQTSDRHTRDGNYEKADEALNQALAIFQELGDSIVKRTCWEKSACYGK
jgi:hypothetical protein